MGNSSSNNPGSFFEKTISPVEQYIGDTGTIQLKPFDQETFDSVVAGSHKVNIDWAGGSVHAEFDDGTGRGYFFIPLENSGRPLGNDSSFGTVAEFIDPWPTPVPIVQLQPRIPDNSLLSLLRNRR